MTLRLIIKRPGGLSLIRSGLGVLLLLIAVNANAQQDKHLEIGGYASFGQIDFSAKESFTATIGKPAGPLFGGGGRVGLPWLNLFVDVGAWQYKEDGQRVAVLNGDTYPLGIPMTVTVTPLEFTFGYRFNQMHKLVPRLTPYAGAGFTSLKYAETSSFAAAGEDVDERFTGHHFMGGAELKILKWLGVAGEFEWLSVPDAIGTAGVSKEFGETDLGGSTIRGKITIGR